MYIICIYIYMYIYVYIYIYTYIYIYMYVIGRRLMQVLRWTYIETLVVAPIRIFVTFSGSDDAHGSESTLSS